MTHPDNNFRDIVGKVSINIGRVFGIILLCVLFLISIHTPIAYYFEFSDIDNIPIFINWYVRKQTNRSRFKLMAFELWNTFLWTTYTFAGTQTGYPNSTGARLVHSSAKIFNKLILVISISAVTAVMTVNYETSNITGYLDLKGQTVCTVVGTTSESYLNSNNVGFSTVSSLTVTDMFNGFYDGRCSAVVYDFPLLQSAILEREKNGIFDAVIVGPVFNKESYGMVMNPNHPYYEEIKQAFISLNNDRDQIKILDDRWLKKISNVSGKNDLDIPIALIIVPSVLGFGLILFAMGVLWCKYEDNNEGFREKQRDLKQEADNGTIYQGVDQLTDKIIVPYIMRLMRVTYEESLARQGFDVNEIEEGLVPRRRRRFVVQA
jgi:hypothetical protein